MIDHISIAVRDLDASTAFYAAALAPLELTRLVDRPAMIGFGKRYPELWLNARPAMAPLPADVGAHVALRAPSPEAVIAFHAAALAARRHLRRPARPPRRRHDHLLRRLRPRPRRQPHRGSTLSTPAAVIPERFPPIHTCR